MEFKAEVRLEYGDFVNWFKLFRSTANRTKSILSSALAVFLSFAFIVMMTVLVLNHGFDKRLLLIIIPFVLCIAVLALKNRIYAAIAVKTRDSKTDFVLITVNDEGIAAEGQNKRECFEFSEISSIYHYEATYFLIAEKRHPIFIPERSFEETDLAEFESFLKAKTDKVIKKIQ